MSLNIKSPEAERLARELAASTGETLTGAITTALHERLTRLQDGRRSDRDARLAAILRIAGDSAGRWSEDHGLSAPEDVLYDDQGLPA